LVGGDLFDSLLSRGSFNERDAAYVAKQLLSGIGYLHSHGIIHGEARAALVMLEEEKSLNIKIGDYEMSLLKLH